MRHFNFYSSLAPLIQWSSYVSPTRSVRVTVPPFQGAISAAHWAECIASMQWIVALRAQLSEHYCLAFLLPDAVRAIKRSASPTINALPSTS
jgi:hypothetical protein